MKIVICGSMIFSKEMMEIKSGLEKLGHIVILPRNAERYAKSQLALETKAETVKNKIKYDLIRAYYQEIEASDGVLILNYDKGGIDNYVGGNSFLEAGFAHILNKKVYFLYDIPKMLYSDELKALQPIIIDGDLTKI
ncbi:MAG: hypothetical protein WC719_00915 [Patescibacteria group bacterium]|jgi:hypothetical protein